MELLRNEPVLKRVPVIVDKTNGIQAFDRDNLYPQRADEIRKRSHTVKACVDSLARFLYGMGWEDPALATLVINSKGKTMNDLLRSIVKDAAIHDGHTIHAKYDLNYRVAELAYTKFMYCRLGLPDEDGDVYDIKYNTNWERDPYKSITRTWNIEEYPIFNPSPGVVREQFMEYGLDGFPGQLIYSTPDENEYPLCTFDPVFDDAQTQGQIAIGQAAGVQNGFTASGVFKYPGTFESDGEKNALEHKLNKHKGPRGNNSMLVVEVLQAAEKLNLFEAFTIPNVDKMYEFTSKNVKNSIRECFSIPAEIVGVLPDNGMFNKENIQQAYAYFNAVTQERRDAISRQIRHIMQYWRVPLNITNWNILPKQYIG